LLWLRLPLPYQLNHVNIYLIAHQGGFAVVDTGIDMPETRRHWDALLQGPLRGQKITRLIVSHCHPDHVGMAGWLTDRFGCPLTMTRTEYLMAAYFETPSSPARLAYRVGYYARHGIPPDTVEALLGRGSDYLTRITPLPPAFERVADGDVLSLGERSFEVLTGGGHSDEQMMLLSRQDQLFLSADQVLSKISPNVSVFATEPEANPLADFLISLQRLSHEVPDDTLVLPGHGVPFHGLKARLAQLRAHHAERCDMIAAACVAEPLTASEFVPKVFHRPLDAHQFGFAASEVVAHLNYMVGEGRLARLVAANGVIRFKAL
jgi:glyoxylase-like metal-dependent hydrolase (beta-lactamase superfamily II)